ncbi:hypothetical protein B484DRAFT_454922, partial [Ochromonadaceae sp. CCMP2298]
MLRNLDRDFVDAIFAKYGRDVRSLNLSQNGLQKLHNIEAFDKLVKLNLSCNDIREIGPLASLHNLVELNLEQNEISDISALGSLSQLQLLDLRGNQVGAQHLQALASIPALRYVRLAGNPVVLGPDFPQIVFALCPGLLSVDDWQRDDPLFAAPPATVAPAPASSAPDPQSSVERLPVQVLSLGQSGAGGRGGLGLGGLETDEQVRSLKAQLSAMDDAFSLQERALTASGEALATLASRLATPPAGSSSSGGSGGSGGGADGEVGERQLLEQFPYYRLLQTWRRQALNSTLQRTFSEQQLQRAVAAMKRDRKQLLGQVGEKEAQALAWRQRASALEEQCSMRGQQQTRLAEALRMCEEQREEAEAGLASARRESVRMGSFLQQAQGLLDAQTVQRSAQMLQGAERLRNYEKRVAAAADRVSFAAAVVAQRELSVRNSQAALEAERRLLQWGTEKDKHEREARERQGGAVAGAGSAVSVGSAGGALPSSSLSPSPSPPQRFLSDLRVEAEAEALLRAVFRRLDNNDSGCVPARHLLACLLKPQHQQLQGQQQQSVALTEGGYDGESGGDCDEALTQTQVLLQRLEALAGSRDALRAELETGGAGLATPLGALLGRALGAASWLCLLRGLLAQPEGGSLTWGECLLQLVPPVQGQGRSALTCGELRAFSSAGLLGDRAWGVVPLDLAAAVSATSSTTTISTSFDPQLVRERRFLMAHVQEMARTLERRAEGIRSYFEADIRREALKGERLAAQLAETLNALAVSEARVREGTAMQQAARERSEQRLGLLTAEGEQLRMQLQQSQSEEGARCEALLREAAGRAERLEAEGSLARREGSRREVRCRALQRDLLRLQAAQAGATQGQAQLQGRLEEALAMAGQVGEQRQVERGAWEAERAELQAQLLETQGALLRRKEEQDGEDRQALEQVREQLDEEQRQGQELRQRLTL